MPVPVIETERLVLRGWRDTDLDAAFAYASDPEFFRYLTVPPVETLEDERRWLDEQLKRDPRVHPAWAITLRGVPIGGIHALVNRGTAAAEIGYGVGRTWWRQGYTTEAAAAVAAWLFENTRIEHLGAVADSRNVGSWRVMEKLGMRRQRVGDGDRIVHGETADTVYYSVARADWKARTR